MRSGLAIYLDRGMRWRESEMTVLGCATLNPARLPFGSAKDVPGELDAWISREQRTLLLSRANDAARGKILCFGRWCADYGDPVDWYLNPTNGCHWKKDVHWSVSMRGASRIGDVKLTWEIGRFPHAYLMGRAAAFFPDQAQALLGGLLQQLESFEHEVPFGMGIHWHSGQETVIRALALLFAYRAFGCPDSLKGFAVRALCRTGLYVQSHIEYAREAVYNNHLIWEALGLYMAGSLLKGIPEASQWETTGKAILGQQADRQIYADGGYIQQSHTYHRMALQAYLIASRLAGEVPAVWRAAMERSLDFLVAQQDPESGQLPNYGTNDGTLPCILSTCDYTDFRPTLQAISVLVRGERQYQPGPWDEEAAWLLGAPLPEAPVHQSVLASRSFEQTGQHVLRGKTGGSFGVFRCGTLRDRFSQIDMLHLDVWWRGHNVLVDSGSYLYNGPVQWHNHFLRTESHNTVQVDGRDQMLHHRRFKCIYWTKAELKRSEEHADWAICTGEHYGYQRDHGNSIHRRSVLFVKDNLWVVVDQIEGSGTHKARLHWLGGEFAYHYSLDGSSLLQLETPSGPFHIAVFDTAGRLLTGEVVVGQTNPPRGWLSRYYGEKTSVPSFTVEVCGQLPLALVSILGASVQSVVVTDSTWSVTADGMTVEFECTAAGVSQPRLAIQSQVVA